MSDLLCAITLDDDPIISTLIEGILGFKTFSFTDVTSLARAADSLPEPTCVFVDIHLAANECGLDVIPGLRERWPGAPVIVITADETDELVGQALSAGAQDFIRKPFKAGELLSRLRARREELRVRMSSTQLSIGDLTLHLGQRHLTGPNGEAYLSPREVEILSLLIRANGITVAKSELHRRIWGKIHVSNNAIDRKLFEVRKAIRAASANVELKSLYGGGIVLRLKSHTADQFNLDNVEVRLNATKKAQARDPGRSHPDEASNSVPAQ